MSEFSSKTAEQKVTQLLRHFHRPVAGTWERVELDIKRNRMGWGTVILKDSAGGPIKNCEIKVRQKTHDFKFGCNAFKWRDFEEEEKNTMYEEYFCRVFNEAVIPTFWYSLEPERGRLRYSADSVKMDRRPPIDPLLDWCDANGVAPKGHWLFCDNFVPDWLPTDSRKVMELLEERIADLGVRYGKRIRKWDVVNESFTFHPRRGPGINDSSIPPDYVWQVFKMAEKYFPLQNEFIYNDGEGISFLGFAYDSSPMFLLADRLLRRGAKLDALGMQFHMYGDIEAHVNHTPKNYFDPAHILRVMDQLGQLHLPLHISEVSLPTFAELPRELAEELQAECFRGFYRLWFSQKNCESIVYWNLCDKTAFGGESIFDAGLIGANFEEKPSYRMLDELVNREWKTVETIATDEYGEACWNGFYGDYELEIDGIKHACSLVPRSENRYIFRG